MPSLKTLGAIGGAVAIAACWPLAVGQLAQNQIEKQIANLDPSAVKVELLSYDRGYLSSQAQTQVTVIDPNLKQMLTGSKIPTAFKINHAISHGIWSVSSHSDLDAAKIPAQLDTTTYLTGSSDLHFRLDNFEQTFEDNSKVNFKPLTVDLNLKSKGNIDLSYQSEGLDILLSDQESLKASAFNGGAQGFKQGSFWIGSQHVDFDTIALKSDQQPDMTIDGLSYQYQTDLTDEESRLTNQSIAKAKSIDYQNLKFEDLDFEFGINNVDSQAFTKLVELLQSAQAPDAQQTKQMMDYVNVLFAQGFDAGIKKFDVKLGEGQVKSQWNVTFPENSPSPTKSPLKLVTSMTVYTDTLVTEEILTQFPELKPNFDKLIKLNMMEKTEQGYVLKGRMEDGTMTFSNGTSMPYMMLAAMFF